MDINLLHLAVELSVTACLFFLSWINVSSAAHGRYSLILALGAAGAGIANLIHIAASVMVPHLEFMSATMLGSASQFVLLAMFGLVTTCSKRLHCPMSVLIAIMALPVIGAIGVDAYQLTHEQLAIFQHVNVLGLDIYYPFYLFCAAMWGLMAYLVNSKRNFLFPPYTSTIFFSYAIVANIMVAFISPENIELCNMLAHALKLTGYYTVILMYLVSNFRFDSCARINTKSDHSSHPIRN